MKFFCKTNAGFTLIELLTVISIISLLSSVVLASLKSAKEKARIAASEQYESTVNAQLGDSLIAEYNFDETGNTIKDSTGVNDLTTTDSGRVSGVAGNAMDFNTNNDRASGGAGSFKNFNYEEGTISFWIYPKEIYSQNPIFAAGILVPEANSGFLKQWSPGVPFRGFILKGLGRL